MFTLKNISKVRGVYSLEEYKEIVIMAIQNAKEDILSLKNDIVLSRNGMEEVEEIMNELNEIKLYKEENSSWLEDKIQLLEHTLKGLLELRYEMLLNMIDQVFKALENKLLDGICFKNVKNKPYLRDMFANEIKIGTIDILDDELPEIKMRVTVYENNSEFNSYEQCKMYTVLSFIMVITSFEG